MAPSNGHLVIYREVAELVYSFFFFNIKTSQYNKYYKTRQTALIFFFSCKVWMKNVKTKPEDIWIDLITYFNFSVLV